MLWNAQESSEYKGVDVNKDMDVNVTKNIPSTLPTEMIYMYILYFLYFIEMLKYISRYMDFLEFY